MKDIETRADIFCLVTSFYGKIREDKMLGPIFDQFVEDWDFHLQKITSFWESNLFSAGTYRGNPIAVHQEVDEAINHSLEETHFNRWVELWHQTVESMFVGSRAELAKQRANNIANIMFIKLYQMRN